MRNRFGKIALTPFFLLLAALPAWAYDANGVALGGTETEIRKRFPSAHCKPLEWASRAADRRCDDARIPFAGVEARVTFFLRKDTVQAFDVRFDTKDLDLVTAFLKTRYGAPLAEAREQIQRKNQAPREVYKVRWEKGADRALLTSRPERKRSQLSVSRGGFDEEIHRVR